MSTDNTQCLILQKFTLIFKRKTFSDKFSISKTNLNWTMLSVPYNVEQTVFKICFIDLKFNISNE